jgi:pimeloyl-ACP methyl ester carboxylesterase
LGESHTAESSKTEESNDSKAARPSIGIMMASEVSMRTMRLPCPHPKGEHMISLAEWGREDAPRTAICVHGLTRNGRDFDRLAAALADHWRVVAIDVVGRGKSDWLEDPLGYNYRQYVVDVAAIIQRLKLWSVDWIGTSMGGIIGMMIAAQEHSPIKRLVLNDVGPLLTASALRRIAAYLAEPKSFASVAEVEAYMRSIYAPFGELPDAEWMHMAEHGCRRDQDGRLWLAHDPKIAEAALSVTDKNIELWDFWDKIHCPVLLLRGELSDLVSRETAAEMARRGPRATVIEIPKVGHAPALRTADQIHLIRDWLEQTA